MNEVNDLMAGIAGEHLVCADLILKGYNAFLSDQGLPYDVVADINGRLLKIQVKTTRTHSVQKQNKSQVPFYIFHIKRCGKGGAKKYNESDVDLFAVVALDSMSVGYVNPKFLKSSLFVRVDKFKGTYLNEKRKNVRLSVSNLSSVGIKKSEIAKKLGLDASSVGRMLDAGVESDFQKGVYFSDLTIESALL